MLHYSTCQNVHSAQHDRIFWYGANTPLILNQIKGQAMFFLQQTEQWPTGKTFDHLMSQAAISNEKEAYGPRFHRGLESPLQAWLWCYDCSVKYPIHLSMAPSLLLLFLKGSSSRGIPLGCLRFLEIWSADTWC